MKKVQQRKIYMELDVAELLSDLFEYDSQYLATILQFDRLLMLAKNKDSENNSFALGVIMKSLKKSFVGQRLSIIKIIGHDKILVLSASRNEYQSKKHIKKIVLTDKIIPVKHVNIGHVHFTELDKPFLITEWIFNCKLTKLTHK
jgi:hypothetical protein